MICALRKIIALNNFLATFILFFSRFEFRCRQSQEILLGGSAGDDGGCGRRGSGDLRPPQEKIPEGLLPQEAD